MRDLGNAARNPGYVVASSDPVPPSNTPGDNPPHAKAKAQYLRIVPSDFLCTHEHPDKKNPQPITFDVTEAGFSYRGEAAASAPLGEALTAAGGAGAAPRTGTGFGRGGQ